MIHILGIAGTFMAGIAALAKEAGVEVSGSDARVYPPMSTLLDELGISMTEGYENTTVLNDKTIVIGNALSRGNPSVEYVLDHKLPYVSGPQWLHEQVLRDKSVLAVAGTHGKTTTSSILAWILHKTSESNRQTPGFLIGGKPGNFEQSAQLGNNDYFVVEADEYDTAFFDKRSKFVHYHPRIVILNNLEFDHADIFPDLKAIKTQFHHLVRTVPQNGCLIVNADEAALKDVLDMGCWTPVQTFSIEDDSADWVGSRADTTASVFDIHHAGETGRVNWPGLGDYDMSKALAAVAAACQTGIALQDACNALSGFRFPNKRLQQHRTQRGFALFEDFAHHPTAIRKTLTTLGEAYPGRRLVALLELRSNTMQMGIHRKTLAPALAGADIACIVCEPHTDWALENQGDQTISQYHSSAECLDTIRARLDEDDVVVVMSNGSFDGLVEDLSAI